LSRNTNGIQWLGGDGIVAAYWDNQAARITGVKCRAGFDKAVEVLTGHICMQRNRIAAAKARAEYGAKH
jgi:hypothetical protein